MGGLGGFRVGFNRLNLIQLINIVDLNGLDY